MKKTFKQALLIAAISLGTVFSAHADLQPYTATYYATFDRFSGKNTSSLIQDTETGEYTYSSYTKPRGIAALAGKIRESLIFTIIDYKVIPKAYLHKSRKRASVNYDWSTGTAIASEKDKSTEIKLTGDELDLQSMQMQLMEDMNNDSLKNQYQIIKGTAVSTYDVEKLGTEQVTIGKTVYDTVKLKQQRKGSSRHTLIWLGTDIQHVTVKMEQYKGEKLRGTLTLTAYKPATQK